MSDCPTTFDYLSLAVNLVLAGAAVYGVVTASRGLSTWRKQIKGKTAHDCAVRIIQAVASYNKASNIFRHPKFKDRVYQSAKALADGTERDTSETEKEFIDRHRPLIETFLSIDNEIELATAIWGGEAEEELMELIPIHHELEQQLGTWLYYARENFSCREDLSALIKPLSALAGSAHDGHVDEYGERLKLVLKNIKTNFAKRL